MQRNYYEDNSWVCNIDIYEKDMYMYNLICLYLEMSRNPPQGVSVGLGEDENLFHWEVMLVGPPDTLYEGGFFKAKIDFPGDFPNMPPKMTIVSEMWHPNGKVKERENEKVCEYEFILK